MKKRAFFSPLIYLCHFGLLGSYFIQWINISLPFLFILMLKLFQIGPVGAPSGWFLCPLTWPCHSLSTSLHFGTVGYSSSSQPWNQPCLLGPCSWWRECKLFVLGVLVCYQGVIACRPSQLTELRTRYIPTYEWIHTYSHTCVYIY